MIDDELLEILACPACRGSVRREAGEIVCTKCGRRYPIRQEIPIMLEEESKRGENDRGT